MESLKRSDVIDFSLSRFLIIYLTPVVAWLVAYSFSQRFPFISTILPFIELSASNLLFSAGRQLLETLLFRIVLD